MITVNIDFELKKNHISATEHVKNVGKNNFAMITANVTDGTTRHLSFKFNRVMNMLDFVKHICFSIKITKITINDSNT